MRVLVAPSDAGGCGFYRLIAPSQALADEPNLEITVDVGASTIMLQSKDGHVTNVMPLEHDVVVFQRPLDRTIAEAIPFIRANGTAVVVELDDDFWHLDKRHIDWKSLSPGQSPERNYDHLAAACRAADLVTVSTASLARAVPSSKICVLANQVPESYLSTKVLEDANWDFLGARLVVGWTGSELTHPTDLPVMGDGLVRAVRKNSAVFLAIGSPNAGSIVGFREGESAYLPWVALDRYPSVIKRLDLGVVPLQLSVFNESKSYLKGLEYAALGVPFVASATSEYRRLAALGAGTAVEQKHDWLRAINRVLTDASYRQEQVEGGIETAKTLTYERHSWRWVEAWEKAVTHFRSGV